MKNTRPQFLTGNAIDVLKDFDDDSVDLVCTSPPYWGLRDYGTGTDAIWGANPGCRHDWGEEQFSTRTNRHGMSGSTLINSPEYNEGRQKAGTRPSQGTICHLCGAWKGQLGLEPTWQLYVEHLVIISREVKRILKPTGSYYLVLGDTYAGGGGHHSDKSWGKVTKGLRNPNPQEPQAQTGYDSITKPKQKLLLPFSVARGLQEDGWICRNDITWHKPNNMPGPWKDRLTNTTELIFHMVNNSKTLLWKNRETGEWIDSEPQARYIPCPDCGGLGRIPRTQGIMEDFMDMDIELPPDDGDNGYDGKFAGMGEVAEKFGSPRARTQRKSAHSKTLKCRECNGKGQVNVWMGFDYWYDLDAIRKPHSDATIRRVSQPTVMQQEGGEKQDILRGKPTSGHASRCNLMVRGMAKNLNPAGKNPGDAVETRENGKYGRAEISRTVDGLHDNRWHQYFHPLGKNPGDYWSITTKGFPGAHFAVFPEDLIEPIIKSSCPPDGVVLDPFCGSGTTNLVAMKLGRASIGIDINPDYIKIAQKRCRVDISSLQDFGGEDE